MTTIIKTFTQLLVCLKYGDCFVPLHFVLDVFIHIFRFDALALSVITATWLAGWVAGWLSHSGIVSKPLNLSENFYDHLKAPSF